MRDLRPWVVANLNVLGLTGLLAAAALNHLVWSIAIPFAGAPYGAPDEIHHFETTRFIAQAGRMPVFGADKDLYIRVRPGAEDNIYNRIYGWQALFPPGAYILAGQTLRLLGIHDYPDQVRVARWLSIVYNLITIYLAYRIARLVFDLDSLMVWGVTIVVSNIPQFVFVGSYHNPDSFTAATSTAAIFLGLRLMRGGWSSRGDALLWGLVLALSGVSKQNGWIVSVLTFILIIFISLFLHNRANILNNIPFVVIPPAIVVGSWFMFQQQNYGDILAREVFARAWSADRPFFVPYAQKYTFVEFVLKTDWIILTFRSFWGLFGYMSVPMHSYIYTILLVLCGMSGLGLSAMIFRMIVNRDLKFRSFKFQSVLIFVLISASIIIASALHSFYNDYQPQGRYLFPGIVPIVILLMMGWRKWLSSFAKYARVLISLWILTYMFSIFCLFSYVIPGMRLMVTEEWFY